MRVKLHTRDNSVEAPKFCAKKETQAPTNVHLIQPKPYAVDLIQFVGESLFDEAKIQLEREILEDVHNGGSGKFGMMVFTIGQDKVVSFTPPIVCIILDIFNMVEQKASLF